ncbi:hypothetical protein SETIT_2G129900v2 [Setaria italica]|uniref:Uncharacterized protein n=1 Tax=Setaria italica TaxID=4555 RepID=A0A368Q0G3_SETIT|nr:hypothetical protein SETIT_2G129900v2 [Setaria italica]
MHQADIIILMPSETKEMNKPICQPRNQPPPRSAPACPYEPATKKRHGILPTRNETKREILELKEFGEIQGPHTNLGPGAGGSLPGQESGEFPVWQQNSARIPHGIRRCSPSSGSVFGVGGWGGREELVTDTKWQEK